MAEQQGYWPGWARHISPNALIAGVVVSFVGCCLAGWLASRHNPFEHFERFHPLINAESLYYPTAGQVRALGRERLDPGKIAVVVGGTSRLQGAGQPEAAVWTRRLQAELGDQFYVLNLAMRAGNTFEFGEPAAEMLLRDHPRLIFVSDNMPGADNADPDGKVYRCFFWDAFYKGWLLPAPRRNARLKEVARKLDEQDQAAGRLTAGYSEMKLRMRLDSALYFTDLWSWVAYRDLFTLWTPQSQRPFTRPRRSMSDNEPEPQPLDRRFATPYFTAEMEGLRRPLVLPVVGDDAEGWSEDPGFPFWATYHQALRCSFPDAMRERTVIVFLDCSLHHRNQLSPEEQRLYARLREASIRATEAEGLAVLAVGDELAEEDYADFLHLAPSGGDKMAVQVAAKVRERARALGYFP
jgi:hypothetical protein